ncbi:hypothetical protein QQF64_000530 [Cirrhinus molitorella]|uniref:Uncharacterized protein n=2 Tax=Cirrhinus molitorella TaxID=172907 RepID=A0ABR3NY25_9TELE|nr:hypothetical protein Q8A67_005184 [Cirrhinus molitorella]
MAVDGATREKKKKKKKIKVEDVQDAGDMDVMVCHDVSVQTVVKKEEPLDVNIRDGEKLESKKKKKKKKKLKEEEEAESPVCCHTSVQTTVKTECSDIKISETKKKKKKKIKQEAEQIQEDGNHLVSKKKKAKKQGYEDEVEGIKKKKKVKEREADLEHSVEIVKKKKKRKIDVAEQEQNTELADGEMKKRKKQKEADECEEEEQKVKKKKKKKKSSAEEEPDEITSNKRPEEKRKKLKKKLKSVDEGKSPAHANGGRESASDKKMKKKTKAVADVIEIQEEPVGKKKSKYDINKTPEKDQMKKLKEEHYEDVVEMASKTSDVVFLSEKPGNQDEVSIDQARRLALQREIDKESQPKMNLGQWGTAQFDSSDRQAKFLRLMGGFKKSSQPLTGSTGRANLALGKEGQQTLQQSLLGEFERAQSRRMDFSNRGAGLGFVAPSNKKFAIDANARNSVRFDD